MLSTLAGRLKCLFRPTRATAARGPPSLPEGSRSDREVLHGDPGGIVGAKVGCEVPDLGRLDEASLRVARLHISDVRVAGLALVLAALP